jgi:hypothetical protein
MTVFVYFNLCICIHMVKFKRLYSVKIHMNLTLSSPYVPSQVINLSPPDPNRLVCIHCGKEFQSEKPGKALNQLHGHLSGCLRRLLLRHIKYSTAIVVATMRPNRKTLAVINKYLEEKTRNAHSLAGILEFLKQRGEISSFSTYEVKNSPEFLKISDGVKSYKKILSVLNKQEREAFSAFANECYERRFDELK